ncbi:MAG: hypothetical protein LQ349_003036 [Xanthoria aureola]|nr:MAG: hypothetical protein LQ349_003036 [Xanthoria aureola]
MGHIEDHPHARFAKLMVLAENLPNIAFAGLGSWTCIKPTLELVNQDRNALKRTGAAKRQRAKQFTDFMSAVSHNYSPIEMQELKNTLLNFLECIARPVRPLEGLCQLDVDKKETLVGKSRNHKGEATVIDRCHVPNRHARDTRRYT